MRIRVLCECWWVYDDDADDENVENAMVRSIVVGVGLDGGEAAGHGETR